MGSKRRISKHILPIMLAERKPNQWWVEPFVGGANIIDKVSGKRIGNDINEYLIALLNAVKNGYIPPINISREFYCKIKENPQNYPKKLVGFVGFGSSFGNKWWGSYAHNRNGRNHTAEGSRNLMKQAENLKGIKFVHGNYSDMVIPEKSLIYCDPPYEGVAHYGDKLDYTVFWDWCRDKEKEGHTVFISEYNAPNDFICIKEIITTTTMYSGSNSIKKVEKLFRWEKKL